MKFGAGTWNSDVWNGSAAVIIPPVTDEDVFEFNVHGGPVFDAHVSGGAVMQANVNGGPVLTFKVSTGRVN